MPTNSPKTKKKVMQIPAEVYGHYRKQAEAEFGFVAAKFRAIIMHDYADRITSPRAVREALPPGIDDAGGVRHQVTIPQEVYDFYAAMAEAHGESVNPIFRAIVVNTYLKSMGLPVVDGLPAKERVPTKEDGSKWRGLVTASEERPLPPKRKRGRPKKEG